MIVSKESVAFFLPKIPCTYNRASIVEILLRSRAQHEKRCFFLHLEMFRGNINSSSSSSNSIEMETYS